MAQPPPLQNTMGRDLVKRRCKPFFTEFPLLGDVRQHVRVNFFVKNDVTTMICDHKANTMPKKKGCSKKLSFVPSRSRGCIRYLNRTCSARSQLEKIKIQTNAGGCSCCCCCSSLVLLRRAACSNKNEKYSMSY